MELATIKQEIGTKKKIKWNVVSWIGIFFCVFIISLKPSLFQAMTWISFPFFACLFFYKDFYALWGIFLFFEEQLVIIPGLSVFAIYSMATLFKIMIIDPYPKKIHVWNIPLLIILILYALFALPQADISAAISTYIASGRSVPAHWIIHARIIIGYALDLLFIIMLSIRIREDTEILNLSFKIIIPIAICSGIFGYTSENIFYYAGADSGILRYMGSFNDPNYTSFFCNMSIFILVCMFEDVKWYYRAVVLVILYYFLIATGSLSGLSFNFIGLFIYLFIRFRSKAIGVLIIVVITASLGFMTVQHIPMLQDIAIVKSLQTRLDRQFEDKENTSLSKATSGRGSQWEKYWGYFKGQTKGAKLFGGNIVMSYSIDQKFVDEYENAPHQAYLSFLLNFGFVGTIIMITCYLGKMRTLMVSAYKEPIPSSLLLVLISVMWIFYGFGFDYFGDWRFMVFYFL